MSDLPSGWRFRRLTELVDFPEGQVDPMKQPYAGWILVAPDHVASREGRLIKRQSAAEQGAISGKYTVKPGDVIYSKIRPALRKAVLVDLEGLCSADMYPLRAGKDLDPRFLLAVLLGERFSRFAEAVSGRSGIPKLNRRELAEYALPVPPLREQRRIAEILDAIDAEIAASERVIGKIRQLGSALVESHFAHGGDSKIPREWPKFELADLVTDPICYGIIQVGDHIPDGVPVVIIRDLGANFRSELHRVSYGLDASYARSRIVSDDVLLSIKGTVGRVAVVPEELTGNISRDIARLRFSALVLPQFIGWLFGTGYGQRLLKKSIVGTTRSEISISVLNRMKIPVPSIEEQAGIVRDASLLDMRIQRECSRLDKQRLYRYGLANDLLTGRVRV
ncbi:hypothetical protein GCM10010402_05520 [Actinomadura luteofluorescens]|uniref:restriction endonuclease subunit S n=1 Tax=Actinomadura luteofluorescens TaxID=46163 RepID=UPI0021643B47|nr:restriction endonuclease subunit S [Actinomadura glauciflava]MCR3740787.1 type I restriction enzyme, S subunit [Actinomadura glauciflava]